MHRGAVHLEDVRCDGKAYGGCEAACLIFCKEVSLKRVDGPHAAPAGAQVPSAPSEARAGQGCTENQVLAGTRAAGGSAEDPTYVCQATLLPEATTPLPWWDFRQYWEDYQSGTVTAGELFSGGFYAAYCFVVSKIDRTGLRLSPSLIRLYDRCKPLFGGTPFPRKPGRIPAGEKTPSPPPLHLKAGDVVRVKSHDEILDMLDTNNKNRGLYFGAEEVPYCGRTFRVRSTVDRMIDERTGKMRIMKGNHAILEGAICKAQFSDRRIFCPRAIYPFWREGWLERAEGAKPEVT